MALLESPRARAQRSLLPFVLVLSAGALNCGGQGGSAVPTPGKVVTLDGGADATIDDAGADTSVDDAGPAVDANRVPFDAGSTPASRCPSVFGELPGIPSETLEISSTVMGDFNGDGKTDVAAVGGFALGHGAAGVLVALGNGDGTFIVSGATETAPGNLYSENNAAGLAAGDLNGDGKTDLVADDPTSDAVTVVLGGSDGGVGSVASFATGSDPNGIALGDLNGDGKLDAVTANYGSGDVSLLLGNGDGTLAAPVSYAGPDGGAPSNVLLADFNGDHALDVALLGSVGAGADVAIFLGTGGGALTAPKVTETPNATSFAVLDVNGDGRPDLALTNATNDAVDVILGAGDGTFGPPTAIALGMEPGTIAASDMSGDGLPDLLVSTGAGVDILANSDGGTFAASSVVAEADPAWLFTAGDVNGDGRADLVVAPNAGPLDILVNEGGGKFPPLAFTTYPTGKGASAVVAADLNGDGLLDLAVANAGANTVSVLANVDGGVFAPAESFTELPAGATAANAQASGPVAIAAVDLNGDGQRDLLVLDVAAEEVNVLLNQGKGTFGALLPNNAGGTPTSNPQAMVTGDWNGDGVVDVAVANVFGPAGAIDGNVAVLFGKGGGAFEAPSLVPTFIQPAALASADLLGTGEDDLIVASLSAVYIVTFDTSGHQSITDIFDAPSSTFGALAVADFDGDGRTDFAAVEEFSRQLVVFTNQGGGAFAAATSSLQGSFDLGLVAVDLDADGRPDLIGTDEWSSVVFSRGQAGGFATPAFYAAGNGPAAIAVADLDGDGALDLATANSATGNVGVMLAAHCK